MLEPAQVEAPSKGKSAGQPSGIVYKDSDEILKLIKRSEYKVVDQLLQTPFKIFIMSLLLNSDAHREALIKVLNQAYVDHDVTLGQFDSIVENVTTYSLSNVLINTGSSLNVMAKTTLDRLA